MDTERSNQGVLFDDRFLDKYAGRDPEAQQVIDSMSHIPIDSRPIYPSRI